MPSATARTLRAARTTAGPPTCTSCPWCASFAAAAAAAAVARDWTGAGTATGRTAPGDGSAGRLGAAATVVSYPGARGAGIFFKIIFKLMQE